MNLDDLRVQIDKLDTELVALLEKRMEISKKVGKYKAERNLPVLNINREIEVLKKVSSKLANKEFTNSLEQVYFEIMQSSRGLQTENSAIAYGLLGEKLSHSISPKIHNALFNKNNLEYNYGLFEIEKDNLYKFVELAESYGIKGFNVTIPYKVEIMQYLDEIDEVAKNIGSVNTVKIEKGKKLGYNTDYYGFETLLKNNEISVENKSVIILGSGGSSKTVEYYCLQNKAQSVKLVTRNNEGKDEKFVNYSDLENISYDVIINTTPVGMYPNMDNSPIVTNLIKKAESVVDIIYNPEKTMLLREAETLGKKIANGKLMLLAQGLKAQEIWGACECTRENLEILVENV